MPPNPASLKRLQEMIHRATSSIPQIQEEAITSGDPTRLRQAQQTIKMLSGLADRAIAGQEEPAPNMTGVRTGGAPTGQATVEPSPSAFPPIETREEGAVPRMASLSSLFPSVRVQEPSQDVPIPEPTPPRIPTPEEDHGERRKKATDAVFDAVDRFLDDRYSSSPAIAGELKAYYKPRIMDNPEKAAFILAEKIPARDITANLRYKNVENAARAYKELMATPGEAALQGNLGERTTALQETKRAGLQSMFTQEEARVPVSPREAEEKGRVLAGIREMPLFGSAPPPATPKEPSVQGLLTGTTPPALPSGVPPDFMVGPGYNIQKPIADATQQAQATGATPQGVIGGLQREAMEMQGPGLELEKEFIRRLALLQPRQIPPWERFLTALAYGAANIFSRWISRNWRMPLNFPDLFAQDRRTDEVRRQLAMQLLSERAQDRRQQASITARAATENARATKTKADSSIARLNAQIRMLEASNRAEADSYRINAEPIVQQMDGMMKIMNEARDPVTGALDAPKYNAAFLRYQELSGDLEALAQKATSGIRRPVIK